MYLEMHPFKELSKVCSDYPKILFPRLKLMD